MNHRRIETLIAIFTLCSLVVYFPVETLVSYSHGLLSPYYLIDLIAMILLCLGAVRSLRARPAASPWLQCAAYGWAAANGWRSTAARMDFVREGRELQYGVAELWIVAGATLIGLIGFGLLLWLVWAADRHR